MRRVTGVGLGVAALLGAGRAGATTALELGENGSEQMARGGAWMARASDPLATFYNPAGLAGQETRFLLQGNINIQSQCFTRLKALNDATQGDGNPNSAASATIQPGQSFPQVCNNAYSPGNSAAGPNYLVPQLGFTYRVNPRLGIGFVFVTPSAAPASQTWPDTLNGGPSPQRYLLLNGAAVLVTPTIGIGWEPVDNLRLGASFIWGIANLDFQNSSWGNNSGVVGQPGNPSATQNDVHGEVNVSQGFIPGFTLGAIYSPMENLDIAAWYKFMSSIDAKGYARTTVAGGQVTDTTMRNCGLPGGPPNCAANDAEVKVPVPMEAKLGVRYHKPRAGVDQAHKRDPMSTDSYDVEVNLTWANDSAFSAVNIYFPAAPNAIPVNGTPGVTLPGDASVPHNFQDVFGFHLGGDVNIIPDMMAIRAGGYYQTPGKSSTQYQNIDFTGEWEAGLALGVTSRIHLHDIISGFAESSALDLSLGFGHTFIGTSTNTTQNGIQALSGTACNGGAGGTNVQKTGTNQCTDGTQINRTEWPVNLGTITGSFNQINLGATYRF
jgi:long-chain fatty acid transport protein